MQIDIITLFPEAFAWLTNFSIVGRAIKQRAIELNIINLRDYAINRRGQVDDYPYGGGAGMVLRPEPLAQAIEALQLPHGTPVIYTTPQGKPLLQQTVHGFSLAPRMAIICGHYEEIDQRIREAYVTHELSIGDYVLSGGELPAMVLVDSLARLADNVLNHIDSALDDSFADGLLGVPQYTRPPEFNGMSVPAVLLSGNHALIEAWRREKSWETTKRVRPDLLEE